MVAEVQVARARLVGSSTEIYFHLTKHEFTVKIITIISEQMYIIIGKIWEQFGQIKATYHMYWIQNQSFF